MNIDNLKQSLLEEIEEWLDSEHTKSDMPIQLSKKENEEIHIAMADAALEVLCSAMERTRAELLFIKVFKAINLNPQP